MGDVANGKDPVILKLESLEVKIDGMIELLGVLGQSVDDVSNRVYDLSNDYGTGYDDPEDS